MLLEAIRQERRLHQDEVVALKTQVEELKEQVMAEKKKNEALESRWKEDTVVSDTTRYLYSAWIDGYSQNPAITQILDGASTSSRMNRVMCTMFAFERNAEEKKNEIRFQEMRNELMRVRSELEALNKAAALHLPLLSDISKKKKAVCYIFFDGGTTKGRVMAENTAFQTRIRELEEYVKKVEAHLLVRTENAANALRTDYDRRRQAAHDIINDMHIKLMASLHTTLKEPLTDTTKAVIHDTIVNHLEAVRLVILRT